MNATSRHRFTRLAIVSMVLGVAAIAGWALSYSHPVSTTISFVQESPHGGTDDETDWCWIVLSRDGAFRAGPYYSFYFWRADYWKLVILFFALPARRWIPWERINVRQHRLDHGLCVHCGYDLRASPEKCPECGTTVTALPAAAGERRGES